jgi:hypothetical protein
MNAAMRPRRRFDELGQLMQLKNSVAIVRMPENDVVAP